MSLDAARVAEVTASLIEHLDEKYGPDADIGQVVVVAEVLWADDNDEQCNAVEVQSSDDRAWTVFGLLSVAADGQQLRYDLEDDGNS